MAVTQTQGIPPDFVKIIPHLPEKQGKRLPRSSNISQVSTATLASISKTVPPALLHKPKCSRTAPKVLLGSPRHCGKNLHIPSAQSASAESRGWQDSQKAPHSLQGENRAQLLAESSPAVWHRAGRLLPLQGTLQHPAGCSHCFHSTVGLSPPQIFSTSVPVWLHRKHLPWKRFARRRKSSTARQGLLLTTAV